MEVNEVIILDSDESEENAFVTDTVDDDSFRSLDSDTGEAADAEDRSQEETFQCPSCVRMFSGENGIVLNACEHWLCKECIIDYYFKNQKFVMRCEFKLNDRLGDVCGGNISENEIRFVLSEIGMDQLDETINPNSMSQHTEATKSITRNQITFCCGICCLDCPIGVGVKLTTCSHHVCEPCLRETIKMNTEPEIKCPYSRSYESCASWLTHSEIQNLTSEEEFLKFKQIAIKKANEPCELFLLTLMDQLNYISNVEPFDCPICFVPCNASEGIKLRDCLHEFCLECFTSTVTHSDDEPIKCPFTNDNLAHCESSIQEREIRAIVSNEVYNKFLERKLKFAEHSIANTFHCKTVDCPGFGIVEAGDKIMICPICRQHNCLECKAIHGEQTCEDYQDSLTGHFKVTERYINNLKDLGDVMNCPKCDALINKTAGCSWILCAFCKTEICWATKGPRWGPNGTGDTSGGCKCKINGKLCHPQCGNCH